MTQNPPSDALRQLLARCRDDAAFQAQLRTDPRTALAAAGIAVPADIELRVLESTPERAYLPLPARSGELSDAALDGVAGGASFSFAPFGGRDPEAVFAEYCFV